jgi:hypothetical protein
LRRLPTGMVFGCVLPGSSPGVFESPLGLRESFSRVTWQTRVYIAPGLKFELALELHVPDQEVLRHFKPADERAEFNYLVLLAYFRRQRE